MSASENALESRIEQLERHIAENSLPSLMTAEQVCAFVQISEDTFYTMKRAGNGPQEIRYNARLIRYDQDAVKAWAKRFTVGQV